MNWGRSGGAERGDDFTPLPLVPPLKHPKNNPRNRLSGATQGGIGMTTAVQQTGHPGPAQTRPRSKLMRYICKLCLRQGISYARQSELCDAGTLDATGSGPSCGGAAVEGIQLNHHCTTAAQLNNKKCTRTEGLGPHLRTGTKSLQWVSLISRILAGNSTMAVSQNKPRAISSPQKSGTGLSNTPACALPAYATASVVPSPLLPPHVTNVRAGPFTIPQPVPWPYISDGRYPPGSLWHCGGVPTSLSSCLCGALHLRSVPIGVRARNTCTASTRGRQTPPCGDTWECQVVIALREIAQATACTAKKRSRLITNRNVRS